MYFWAFSYVYFDLLSTLRPRNGMLCGVFHQNSFVWKSHLPVWCNYISRRVFTFSTIFHAEFFENACRRSREIVIYVFPNWLYINHKALFCNTLAPFELSNGGRAANYISRRVFAFSTIFHAEFLLSQLYFTQSFLKMTAGWVGALLFICSQIDYMSIIKPEFAILLPLLDYHMGQEYQLYFTQSFWFFNYISRRVF